MLCVLLLFCVCYGCLCSCCADYACLLDVQLIGIARLRICVFCLLLEIIYIDWIVSVCCMLLWVCGLPQKRPLALLGFVCLCYLWFVCCVVLLFSFAYSCVFECLLACLFFRVCGMCVLFVV